jgi:hypothetical protein
LFKFAADIDQPLPLAEPAGLLKETLFERSRPEHIVDTALTPGEIPTYKIYIISEFWRPQ